MSETTVNAYATTGTNTAATSPTPVAVVNDGTGDRQIVAIGASDGSSTLISSTPTQGLNVHPDSTAVFYEDWSTTAIDIIGNWNVPQTGLGASITQVIGSQAFATGTTANSYAYLSSQATFQPVAPGFLEVNHSIKFSTLVNHAYAFFGNGTPNSSPTSGAYATDAYGFEMSTTEGLNAVCWASGTRNLVSSLSIPSDSALHKYQIYMRGDVIYWAIDYVQVASISTGALGPNNNYLPAMILVGNDSTGSSGFTLTSDNVYIGDSTKDTIVLQDSTYPQYQTHVTPSGQLEVIDAPAVASLSQIATNTNIIAQGGNPPATIVSVADSLGNPINSVNGALSVAVTGSSLSGNTASTSLPTPVLNSQVVSDMSDKFGRAVTILQATRDIIGVQSTTITASTAATTVINAMSSQYTDITSISLSNSGASATLFTLSDGTNSYYFYVPAGDMRGAVYQVPLPATNTSTVWQGTCGTSTSSLYVTIEYIKNR